MKFLKLIAGLVLSSLVAFTTPDCIASGVRTPATLNLPSVVTPTSGSTAAASSNVALIQAVLNQGGNVNIQCPGPASNATVWLNGHLTIPSNTTLVNDCHLEQVANTDDNMLVNTAYHAAWTTQYINSGLITTGPLTEIWSGVTPAWIATTAYAQGNYVVSNGNIYWENAATCTSAGSGGPSGNSGTSTGPTGTTGAAISDGTCSWYYVTVNANGNTNRTTATVYFPGTQPALGQFVAINPQPDNNTTNQWTCSQTAHTRGGPADSAYFGTFPVVAVNDSNWITVSLKRQPAVAFSGIPIWQKIADNDIYLSGKGIWDSNSANNIGGISALAPVTILFSSIANVRTSGVNVNPNGYGILVNGYENADIGFTKAVTPIVNYDLVKFFGGNDGVIHDTIMNNNNGGEVSIQTGPGTVFNTQYVSSQDSLNNKIINTTGWTASVSVYPSDPCLYLDNALVDGVSINTNPNATSFGTVDLHDDEASATTAGTVTFKNVTVNGGNSAPFVSGAVTVQNLILENFNGSAVNSTTLMSISAASHIKNLTIKDFNWEAFANADEGIFNAGIIDNMYMQGGILQAASPSIGNFLFNNGTVTNFSMSGTQVVNVGIIFRKGDTAATTASFIGNTITEASGSGLFVVFNASTSNVYLAGNNIAGLSNGIVDFAHTATVNLYSGGGNALSAGTIWWNFPVGVDTASSYGFDIKCDVTKMTATAGEFCFNTNAAPGSGTLTALGPIMNQAASAGTNHWFALYSPLLQTY